MVAQCGQVLHQWYVRCEQRKAFGPREIIAKFSCSQNGTCKMSPDWRPGTKLRIHEESVNRWTEVDPDREDVDLPNLFHPFMKLWICEGPPQEQPPPVRDSWTLHPCWRPEIV